MKGNPKLKTTRHVKKLHKFYKTPRNLQSLGLSFSNYPSQRLRIFLPPYERLYLAKRATTMSPQSLIEFILGDPGADSWVMRKSKGPSLHERKSKPLGLFS